MMNKVKNAWTFSSSKTDKLTIYEKKPLMHAFPRIASAAHAEELTKKFLQLDPKKRITADDAIRDKYFADLPSKVFELPARK